METKETDVAREASSLVLLDDHFASIVSAIRSEENIRTTCKKGNVLHSGYSIPIIGLTLMPAFITSPPLLLMPTLFLWNSLLTRFVSIAFESDRKKRNYVAATSQPP